MTRDIRDEIEELPEHIRRYIHQLEAECDPQLTIQQNHKLKQENERLSAECERLVKLLGGIFPS